MKKSELIRSTRYLGDVGHSVTDRWWMVGQDGGQSIPLDADRSLFVFSDTLLAARSDAHPYRPVPHQFHHRLGSRGMFLANCAAVAEGGDLQRVWSELRYFTSEDGFPREVLPADARERALGQRFWPEHGIFLDGRVYLYYLGVQTVDPTTIWGFRTVGSGLAILDPVSGRSERIRRGGQWEFWKAAEDDLHFGVYVLARGPWLFVYGSVRFEVFSAALLARVRAESVADLDAYEYLTSSAPTWGAFEDACDLGLCGGEYSVSFNPHLGCYLMCWVDHYSRMLTMRTAQEPWGPFSEPIEVVKVPSEATSEMVYLGLEHPGFVKDEGRTLYFSYCQPRFLNNSVVSVRLA